MRKFKFLRKYIAIIAISIIIITIISITLRYQVEGEANIPFQISKIMVISNANGIQTNDDKSKWNLNLVQNNDIYLDIVKNKNYNQDEIIEKIKLDNFKIEQSPKKGRIVFYGPQSFNQGVYENKEEYEIKDIIEFIGNQDKSDIKNLQISNQGGLILIRVVNKDLGTYTSDNEEEIRHDGTLLKKLNLSNEELKMTISFDLGIELKSNKNYKTHIELEMPTGNILEEGTTNYQKEGIQKLVFKRY